MGHHIIITFIQYEKLEGYCCSVDYKMYNSITSTGGNNL